MRQTEFGLVEMTATFRCIMLRNLALTLPDLTANIFFSLSFRPSEQRERVEKSRGNAADKIAPRGLKNRAAQKNIIRKKKYLNVRVGNNTYPY